MSWWSFWFKTMPRGLQLDSVWFLINHHYCSFNEFTSEPKQVTLWFLPTHPFLSHPFLIPCCILPCTSLISCPSSSPFFILRLKLLIVCVTFFRHLSVKYNYETLNDDYDDCNWSSETTLYVEKQRQERSSKEQLETRVSRRPLCHLTSFLPAHHYFTSPPILYPLGNFMNLSPMFSQTSRVKSVWDTSQNWIEIIWR